MKNNYLKDKFPEIFAQIDVERTLQEYPGLDINKITCGSGLKIWFKCSRQHLFRCAVKDYLRTKKCPYCSNRKLLSGYNDLQTRFPEIAKDWDYEKNRPIKPSEVLPGSHKKFWFKCNKCGNSYESVLYSRKDHACPYCSNNKLLPGFNDLETWCKLNNRDDILNIWDYDKNFIDPSNINPHSHDKFWFKCRHGHSYKANLNNKTKKVPRGCPICANKQVLTGYNDLETWVKNHPDYQFILDEWDYKKNTLKPSEILPGTHKKIWFKCKNNHSFLQRLYSRTCSIPIFCPYCSIRHSAPELLFYELCKKYIDTDTASGKKINKWEVDVFIPSKNTCVEYDGIRFHNSDKVKDRELRKNKAVLSKYTMIRIKETDNLEDLKKFKEIKDGVIQYYIYSSYRKKYFIRLSKIIFDIFAIKLDQKTISKEFSQVKINKYLNN